MELFKFLELNTILENCQSNGYAFVNPDKIIFVTEKTINENDILKISSSNNFPKIIRKFDDDPTYKSVVNRINSGDWSLAIKEKIKFFKKENKSVISYYLYRLYLIIRYFKLDQLIKSLNRGGELKNNLQRKGEIGDEICVDISESGEIYFANGGTHRLAIAKCLKLKKIPVLVCRVNFNFIKNNQI